MRLIIATFNPGKVREFRELLAWHGARQVPALEFDVVTPDAVGVSGPIEETGSTYAENARLKAVNYAQVGGLAALGDDSGLEVDALDGAPGLYSARYAGHGASNADRRALLLSAMAGVPAERRTARFRCVVAVAQPNGTCVLAEGSVEGVITTEAAGEGGFGYDPVFFIPEFGCTMAELDAEVKNRISHRGRAFAAAMPALAALVARGA